MNLLEKLDPKDLLDFSQSFSVARPQYLGDTQFPDIKTENLEAEVYMLADGASIPRMAKVHAFDTEAAIGKRDTYEKLNFEKLFIKEKLNMSERVALLTNKGVVRENAIINYIYDDMARLAEAVKTRTEVLKQEFMGFGQMTIKENNLDFAITYDLSAEQKPTTNWKDPGADMLGDIEKWVRFGKSKGKIYSRVETSDTIATLMKKNTAVQKAIFGAEGTGRFVSMIQLNSLMTELFGFTIVTNDQLYRYEKADGTDATARFFPENKFTMYEATANGAAGTGLWGVPPEEMEYGQYSEKSESQFITVSRWATPDPVAVWTKASGVFIPVMPNVRGILIATITM